MLGNLSTVRIVCFTVSIMVGAGSVSGAFAQPGSSSNPTDDVSFWAELAFWESVKDSGDPEELRAYIAAYPQGRFVALAQVRIRALTPETGGKPGPERDHLPTPSRKAVAAPDASIGLRPGDTFRDCDVCPQLVVIPAGHFAMGSERRRADETPRHTVVIPRAFAIGVHEVTVQEWDACLREGVCQQNPERGRDGSLPMGNVSWDNAQGYVQWLSVKTGHTYRLATEAEWEYAARAGTTTRYWWGDDKRVNGANCADCGSDWGGKGPSPVGSFAPNPFGLYDVHGNLWEWTQDCWNPSYEGAPSDGGPWLRGDCLSRVLRGGSWALGHEYMRSSRRSRYDRDVRYYLNGLRVVRELPAAVALPAPVGDMPFEAAVRTAVNKVFSNAPGTASRPAQQTVVIDPLIDGLAGSESVATRAMESQIIEWVHANHTQFDVRPFSASEVNGSRYVVVGTFTGVNKQRKTSGDREAFRICLTLLDLESGKIASKAKVFSNATGVDITPTAFYRDSPAWTADASTQAYIRTCQATKPGDPSDPLYLDQVKVAALINEAIDAYDQGQYRRSNDLFERISQSKGGDQLRTYLGTYLTSWKLGERKEAIEAFGEIVNYGLKSGRLGVKFSFNPGSTDLVTGPNDGGQHDIWLAQIAQQAARRKDCLEIVGHTHRFGPERLNQLLSVRQAEYIKRRLEAEVPELSNRMIATGRGSEETLIGSVSGDARDALDRRIELHTVQCTPTG